MKVKKSITKKVNDALHNCRQTLAWAILELCQQIDGEKSGKVSLQHPVTLSSVKTGNKGRISFECNLVNRIMYGPMDRSDMFLLYHNDAGIATSYFISIEDMRIIYNELKKTVLHE